MEAVEASDWRIVQVIMSCWDIKRSSGSNHVLYLISILNCQQAVMNVCLNEVLRSYCIAVARIKNEKMFLTLNIEWRMIIIDCFRTRRAMNVEEAKLERYLHEATHPRDLAWMGPISRSGEV